MNPGKKRIIGYGIILLFLFNLGSVHLVLSVDKQRYADLSDDPSDTGIDLPVYRAVLVAIGYNQGLPYSVKQLNGFKTTLLHGGNWKESNIVELVELKAKRDNIFDAIQWLADEADDNDVSMFYFIGHGTGNDTNQCIIADDGPIYDVTLNQHLENISGSLIVIIDACRSGGFIDELSKEDRIVITACAEDESALQVADLESGMFGFFLNLSLAWTTKKMETSFYWARVFTTFYGNKISEQYGQDYHVHPQISDGTQGMTRIILRHAYIMNVYQMIRLMHDTDNYNRFWVM
jgi:hypothetical protein